MAFEPFDLHDPVIIGDRAHMLLIAVAHGPLLVGCEILLVANVSQTLGNELVSLSFLGLVSSSIFYISCGLNCREILIRVALADRGANWLDFHDIRIKPLRIEEHILLTLFIILLVTLLFSILLLREVHESCLRCVLLLADIDWRLDENL